LSKQTSRYAGQRRRRRRTELAEIKLGRVVEGGFTLKNPNDVPIKDVDITCTVTAPSGTAIHHYRFTIFDIVPAKGEKVIKNYKFGYWPQQGERVGCRVVAALRG
jgi:hypothetical protein